MFFRYKNLFSKVVGYGILIAVLGFYIRQLYSVGFEFDWSIYRFNWYYLICVVILHAIGLIYGSLGWAIIVRSLDAQASLLNSAKVYYATTITRNLPGLVVHFAGRTYLHEKNGQSKTTSMVGMVLEMLIATLASILTYLFFWHLSGLPPVIPQYYPISILIIGFFLTLSPLFRYLISWGTGQTTQSIQINYFCFFSLLLLYFLIIVLGGVILFLTIRVIYPLSPNYLPMTIGIAGFSMAVLLLTFWVPGSFRLRDATLLLVLTDLTNPTLALVITFVWRYLLIISDLFWGIFVLFLMWFNNDRLWQEIQVNFLSPWQRLKHLTKQNKPDYLLKDCYDRNKT